MSESHAISLEHVTVTLPGSPRPVLRDVSLTVDEGELALVVGRTGSGKSTLLGAMCGRVPHFTGGTLAGHVRVHGRDTRQHRPRDLADLVGVVGQDPLAGFVTDTVEEELAYGMEQLGLPAATMRKRVEETLDLLGIADLRHAALRELSGGQQQRVAIGSVLTAHPRVIVLDEPTSALDPTGAEEVLATITRLVHDLAVTVVVAEHRVERVLHYADTVVHVSPEGEVVSGLAVGGHGRLATSPPPSSSSAAGPGGRRCRSRCATPAGRRASLRTRLTASLPATRTRPDPQVTRSPAEAAALSARDVVVRYPGDVVAVAGVDLDLRAGEVTALMGRNGSGKSTLLWALQGTGPRTSGTVRATGPDHRRPVDPRSLAAGRRRALVGLVPQSAADLLYLDTVGGECAQADRESGVPAGTCAALLERHRARHPRASATPATSPRGRSSRSSSPCSSPPTRPSSSSTSRPAAWTPRPRRRCSAVLRDLAGTRPGGRRVDPRRRVRRRERRPGRRPGRGRGRRRRPHRRGRRVAPPPSPPRSRRSPRPARGSPSPTCAPPSTEVPAR